MFGAFILNFVKIWQFSLCYTNVDHDCATHHKCALIGVNQPVLLNFKLPNEMLNSKVIQRKGRSKIFRETKISIIVYASLPSY